MAQQATTTVFMPVASEERLVVLDVLRGFALLGIAIMNMRWFSAPPDTWVLEGGMMFPGFADRAAVFFMETFFSGKANSIFSFLFGLGLTIQMARAEERGDDVGAMYVRRLVVLFVVGVAHAIFVWDGDVLHHYAIIGLLLLALRRVSDRVIFALIVLCFFLPQARWAYAVWTNEPPLHPPSVYLERLHESLRVFSSGTYVEQVSVRVTRLTEWYAQSTRLQGTLLWFFSLATTMLLGFYAGRHRLLSDIRSNVPRFRKALWWSLGLGFACAAGAAVIHTFFYKHTGKPTPTGLLIDLLYALNRPLLCIGYVCAIALLLQRQRVARVLKVLEAPGRMPLTNYLMQSVIATTIFYSYGLGLFGKVGPLLGLLVSVLIFAVQILYSRWWLARFQYGPLEWLWRTAAYGKVPPMRGRRG